MRHGAYDFLLDPSDRDDGVSTDGGAATSPPAHDPHHAHAHAGGCAALVGRTPAMREVFKAIARVAPTRVTVLVTGESGTGKELVARAIHDAGPHASEPFVAVNCAALSASLLESELFGHSRGAFTGAVADRVGRFEVAGEGTILLDEIGELDRDLQAKLLRVLEERRFERVGDSEPRPMLARIVAATNRELPTAVAEGRFREDLLHRLEVVTIRVPPLRERSEDIPLLVEQLRQRIAGELGLDVLVAPDAVAVLQSRAWPGNVRQLYNALQRAVLRAQGTITAQTLAADAAGLGLGPADPSRPDGQTRSLDDVERDHIRATLQRMGWHKRRTAEALGISRVTLDRKIHRYGLKPEGDE